jgi:hypothetical protein
VCVELNKVRALPARDRLLYWVREREAVRLKKESGAPAPWTDDEILRRYRFCNVRRMDDKVSRWLLMNWYEPYRDHPNMLAAVALARFVNLPNSLSFVRPFVLGPRDDGTPDWKAVKSTLRQLKKKGPIFNNAYMVRGNDGIDKVECVVDHYVRPLTKLENPIDPTSMERTHANLLPSYGMGSFMAGQIVADLRWAVSGTWEDRMNWAPRGPGSMRGLNRLFGRGPDDAAARTWDAEFATVIEICKRELPALITDRLEAHDYQNCLCEYDKFCRVLDGEGKPKQLYRSGQ